MTTGSGSGIDSGIRRDLEPTEEYQGDENAYNRALQKLSLQRLLVSED